MRLSFIVSVSMAAMPTCRRGKLAFCNVAVHCGLVVVREAVLTSLALFSIIATTQAPAVCLWSSLSTPLCVVCEVGLRTLVVLGPGAVLVAADERGMAMKATTARPR